MCMLPWRALRVCSCVPMWRRMGVAPLSTPRPPCSTPMPSSPGPCCSQSAQAARSKQSHASMNLHKYLTWTWKSLWDTTFGPFQPLDASDQNNIVNVCLRCPYLSSCLTSVDGGNIIVMGSLLNWKSTCFWLKCFFQAPAQTTPVVGEWWCQHEDSSGRDHRSAVWAG